MQIKAIYDFLDEIAPFDTAADFDNCGLSVGSLKKDVSKILIALDVTSEVIEEAKSMGAELVITHHPLIFTPVSSVDADTLLYKAVASGITFIASHTCLDKAVGGVNHCLADKVGITSLTDCPEDEFLKMGDIEPMTADEFAKKIKSALGGKVSYTDSGKVIEKVALCSGSGGDLVRAAALAGADALLTGEAKHHELLDSREAGISLFAAGHYETEVVVCEYLANSIRSCFADIEVSVSKAEAPIKYK